MLDGFLSGYNEEFLENITYAFMESKELVDKLKIIDPVENKYLFLGYPVLFNIQVNCNNDNDSNAYILWIPRWTMKNDECHFFDYKDELPDYIYSLNKKISS